MLLPTRVPGVEIPNFSELQELHDLLAERVKTWTQEWKDQGLREGRQGGEAKLLRRQLTRRFGPLPSWAEERLGQAGEPELEELSKLSPKFGGLGQRFRDFSRPPRPSQPVVFEGCVS